MTDYMKTPAMTKLEIRIGNIKHKRATLEASIEHQKRTFEASIRQQEAELAELDAKQKKAETEFSEKEAAAKQRRAEQVMRDDYLKRDAELKAEYRAQRDAQIRAMVPPTAFSGFALPPPAKPATLNPGMTSFGFSQPSAFGQQPMTQFGGFGARP